MLNGQLTCCLHIIGTTSQSVTENYCIIIESDLIWASPFPTDCSSIRNQFFCELPLTSPDPWQTLFGEIINWWLDFSGQLLLFFLELCQSQKCLSPFPFKCACSALDWSCLWNQYNITMFLQHSHHAEISNCWCLPNIQFFLCFSYY